VRTIQLDEKIVSIVAAAQGPEQFVNFFFRMRIPLNSAIHCESFRPPIPFIAAGLERSDAGVFLLA
jgi:hypothetical protein